MALVEELEHALAALEVGRVGGELEPLARPRSGTSRISPICAAGPLVIITMRSDSSTASSTSWVIIITVLPSF